MVLAHRSRGPVNADRAGLLSRSFPIGEEVVVLGAGGHTKVILSVLLEAEVRVAGIYDDDPAKTGAAVRHVPVLGTISGLHDTRGHWCVVGVGDNATRHDIAVRFASADWLTIVHPAAYVHPSACLGPGTVVLAGAVVNAGACVGRHCIINTGATVGEDCVVGDFCHVGPGCRLGRTVKAADGVFMGISSVAAHNVAVGAWTMIAAGAAVTTDMPERVVAVGVPARVQRRLET